MTKNNRLTPVISLLTVCTLTLSGCGGNEPAQTTAAASETQVTQTTEAEPPAPRSNPVAMTADGDVDMEVALAYQTDFDALLKQLDAKVVADDHPVSENTDPETLELYRWLKSIYGKQVIAGQQLGNEHDKESLAYYYYTGDLPAIKGFDFIFKTTKFGDSSDWTQMAIDWHTKSGGIVCFCWHWNVPRDINDTESGATSFYVPGAQNGDPGTTFDIAKAVTPGTKEYERAVHDIDLIAYELQRLEAAGVPVLWRPLHEASGSWFWWGIQNKEQVKDQCYQKLWYMIYDRLENYHKLTNLIWVWNGQTSKNNVHKNTYDIAGIDVYPTSENHTALGGDYDRLKKMTDDGKMLALSECGYIPDPDELAKNIGEVKWLYYMPWNGEFIWKNTTLVGIPMINEKKMSVDLFRRAMASDTVITWSELPSFEGTSHELPERIQTALPDIEFQKEKDKEKNN